MPTLEPGYARLAVLFERPGPWNPGTVARASGVPAEALGPIQVAHDQAWLDIASDHVRLAKEHLENQVGPVQVLDSVTKAPVWTWMRLAVGRNNGLTMNQLRRVLERAGATGIGRVFINNTHTLVGVEAGQWPTIATYLETTKINGLAPRPSQPGAGEVRADPAFTPKPRD